MASLKKEIKLLKTVIALLVIIIAALAVYVMYPYINLPWSASHSARGLPG